MNKIKQMLKLLCILSFNIQSSIITETDIRLSQNKELNFTQLDSQFDNHLNLDYLHDSSFQSLPKRYADAFYFYNSIRSSNVNRENIAPILQFLQNTIQRFPLDIKNKILNNIIDQYCIMTFVHTSNETYKYGYCDQFENFTLYSLTQQEGRLRTMNLLCMKPKDPSSLFKLLEEFKSYCSPDTPIDIYQKLNTYIKNFLSESPLSNTCLIKIKDNGDLKLKKNHDLKWTDIEERLKHISCSSLLALKITQAKQYNKDSIVIYNHEKEPLLESLFSKNNLTPIYLHVNANTYENFLKKAVFYNIYISHNLFDPENTACIQGSTVTIINNETGEKITKEFPSEIVLNARLSENGILVAQVINEKIFRNEYGDSHFSGTPAPTYHKLEMYDLARNVLLNSLKLPLPKKYTFNEYGLSLCNVYKNQIFIKNPDKERKNYIVITYTTKEQDTFNAFTNKIPMKDEQKVKINKNLIESTNTSNLRLDTHNIKNTKKIIHDAGSISISHDIRNPEKRTCVKGSTITIINNKTNEKITKEFPSEIVLNARLSPNGVLAVEVIDEKIDATLEDGCLRHPNMPNPTYHEVKLYHLTEEEPFKVIKLPLAPEYIFKSYNFSLYSIDNKKVLLYDTHKKEYIPASYSEETSL